MLTEKYLRKQIRKQLLKLVTESRSNLLIELEQAAPGEEEAGGAEAPAGEEEAAPGTPGSASKSEVVSKLKELIANIADIESSQYGALLAVIDEILELAGSGELKKRAMTITKGLNKFDK